jgi:hypothetical protein
MDYIRDHKAGWSNHLIPKKAQANTGIFSNKDSSPVSTEQSQATRIPANIEVRAMSSQSRSSIVLSSQDSRASIFTLSGSLENFACVDVDPDDHARSFICRNISLISVSRRLPG